MIFSIEGTLMRDICCIGHITRDKVVTPKKTAYLSGGTAFYFSHALSGLRDVDYCLYTALGAGEMAAVEELRKRGIHVRVMPCETSVFFENIYGDNQNDRIQHVLAKAAPFTADFLRDAGARIIHLGALLRDDFPAGLIPHLAGKGLISLDSQGFLREVRGVDVLPVDWREKETDLEHVHFLKANEHEAEALTGTRDMVLATKKIYDWGVKEVVVTLGSHGSIVYDGRVCHRIPAYEPPEVVDATGCGDTYMAPGTCTNGRLGKRLRKRGVSGRRWRL